MEEGDTGVMHMPPRPKKEPIINGIMKLGIGIQTITQTGAVLLAFGIGLIWHLTEVGGLPPGVNPITAIFQYDWTGLGDRTAQTMAFATLSLCELFRAYTVRSEKMSLFKLGVFSNRFMQYAVGFSIFLLILVINVPFLQPIFNTTFLSGKAWAIVLGLAVIPAVSEEIEKFILRWRDRRAGVS
jgi:Ca2+-transporting ATPase